MDWLESLLTQDEPDTSRMSQQDVDTIVAAFEKRQTVIEDYISHELKKPSKDNS